MKNGRKRVYIQGVKKIEQICNRSQHREAAQNMKFFITIDCLGICVVKRAKHF